MQTLANSKLINLLSVYTRTEWRDLKSFIESGVAGPVGMSLKLYHYLSDGYPEFRGHHLDKVRIFNALFGDVPFDDKRLRYAVTDLYKNASIFLKFKALEYLPGDGDQLLTGLLARRGAEKAYLSHYSSDDDNGNGDADSFLNRYRKSYVHLNHYFPRQKRKEESPIGAVALNLDIFFIAKKLQLLCEVINVRNVMSVEYEFHLRGEIIGLLKQGFFHDVPVIAIYYRIYMTLTEPQHEEHFETLKLLLVSHGKLFSREELRDMYQYLMNYCIKKINQGVIGYVSTLFGIYKTILENRVIYNDNVLSQWDFKNIVVIGIRAGEPQWVYEFIERCREDLHPAEKENAYVYNLAYYYFSTGNFKQALGLLSRVEFTDLYYQLDMRAILLKCYFETDDQDAFHYHVAAFRIFISRNRLISDYQRTIYRNFIKFATALVRANGDERKLERIRNEIEEVKQIADLNWIRKKADQTVGTR